LSIFSNENFKIKHKNNTEGVNEEGGMRNDEWE
jgi:hypothetical protein